MAKSSYLDGGEIKPVFYRFGKFPNDQRPRYIRAPFVILKLNGQEYVMPTIGGSSAADLNNILSSDSYDLEQINARADFGFESDEEFVLGEHELGSLDNDTWVGCHKFGVI